MLEPYEEFCPGCRARNRIGSNFCSRCGIRLSLTPAPVEPERRALGRLRSLGATALVLQRSLTSPLARRLLQTTFTAGVATGVLLPTLLRLAGRRVLPVPRTDPTVLPARRLPPDDLGPDDVVVQIVQFTQIVRRSGRDRAARDEE